MKNNCMNCDWLWDDKRCHRFPPSVCAWDPSYTTGGLLSSYILHPTQFETIFPEVGGWGNECCGEWKRKEIHSE